MRRASSPSGPGPFACSACSSCFDVRPPTSAPWRAIRISPISEMTIQCVPGPDVLRHVRAGQEQPDDGDREDLLGLARHGSPRCGVGKRQRSLQVVEADEEYGAGADADRQGDQVEVQERAVGVQLIVLSWGAAAGPTLERSLLEYKGGGVLVHGSGRSGRVAGGRCSAASDSICASSRRSCSRPRAPCTRSSSVSQSDAPEPGSWRRAEVLRLGAHDAIVADLPVGERMPECVERAVTRRPDRESRLVAQSRTWTMMVSSRGPRAASHPSVRWCESRARRGDSSHTQPAAPVP